MCPETEKVSDFYRVKNSYSNVTERKSFNLEIITCNNIVHDTCADEDDIIDFVDHLLFTQYFVMDTIDFRDEANY